jgi:histidinol phosphatase-like PHP family hydrolase
MHIDLHVHTHYSPSPAFGRYQASDCSLKPGEAYRILKERGMDQVTFTDHDTIAGCRAFLDRHPDTKDFFMSEEVTTRFPDLRKRLHVGVFHINEGQHDEITRLKADAGELTAYLRAERIPYALFHPGNQMLSRRTAGPYWERALEHFPWWESCNGSMSPKHSEILERVLQGHPNPPMLVAGSDAHTRPRLASSFTLFQSEGFLPRGIAGRGCTLAAQLGDVHHLILHYLKQVLGPSAMRKSPRVYAFVFLFGLPLTLGGLPIVLTLLHRYNLWLMSLKTPRGVYGFGV